VFRQKEFIVLDELRERVIAYLSHNQVCVLCTNGCNGAWSVIAQYQNRGLELECRVPRWADAIYHLEQDPHALVIILDAQTSPSRWMQYRGVARIIASPDDRYVAIHIAPERVDLIDEKQGYGKRETLDL
jgi:hypothetical protein